MGKKRRSGEPLTQAGFIVMSLKEEGWKVVKGAYRTPEVCPWCSGEIEEKLLEVKFLEGKVRVSKFPKMVCSKCGRSFMNDEQAAYYEKLQEDFVQIYSVETRKSELQTVEA
ncbi:YgiT-type zinc finger protein [Methanophagales archaeon]|nr:MAG: YgiT-type zinc finger protein [Methanophagales archaeon]